MQKCSPYNAGEVLQSYRLSECDVYVTVEPCVMCTGALLQARVKRAIYGITEAKTGAVTSQLQLAQHTHLNHHTAFSVAPMRTNAAI